MYSEFLSYTFGTTQFTMDANFNEVSHEESLKTPPGGGNCMNWIAGHILSTRDIILKQLGEEPVLSEDEALPYQRGSRLLEPEHRCVSFDRLREGLTKSIATLTARLGDLTDENLSEALDPAAFPVPVEKPTRGLQLTLFLFHEAYHAGQLGLGRRLLGKEGFLK